MITIKSWVSQEEYEWFMLWLQQEGAEFLPKTNEYELARWKGRPGKPMPICYRRLRSQSITLNGEAAYLYYLYLENVVAARRIIQQSICVKT
jgi:hypothetical protein